MFVPALLLPGIGFSQLTNVLSQDFTTAVDSTPPAGWDTTWVDGDPTYDVWYFDNPNGRDTNAPIAGNAAIFDSRYNDCQNPPVGSCFQNCNCLIPKEVNLESPVFDASLMDTIILSWDQSYKTAIGGGLYVDAWNGTSWINVYSNTTPTDPVIVDQSITIDIDTIVGVSNAKVRFRFTESTSGGDTYWMIDNVMVNATFSTLSVSITSQNTSCIGGCDGMAAASVNGGTFPYTYQWTPAGGTGSIADSLCAGTYMVVVTDAAAAAVNATVTITEPNALSGTLTSIPDDTAGTPGSATINVSGGTPPYSYLWNTNPVQITQTATGLSGGAYYSVTVTDSCAITLTDSVFVNFAGALSINELIDIGNIIISPNPTTGSLNIIFDVNEVVPTSIKIYNVIGKLITEINQPNGLLKGNYSFDLSEQPDGVYFVKVESRDRVVTRKVTIVR